MNPDISGNRWQKISRIFSEARKLTGSERKQYLDRVCHNDPGLLNEVQSLLSAHEEHKGKIDQNPATFITKALQEQEESRYSGMIIGAYRIVRCIDHGGMGDVFLAERCDGEFEQQVALKILRTGFYTDEQIQRFRSERQILATLNHDNIARLYDGGVTEEGKPYIVMEYIEGMPLHDYCDSHRLTVNQRLDLFIRVCDAVQYAHQNLIVHRDLKPWNILITENGTVKLLDFGIAKVLTQEEAFNENNPVTQSGLLPLTAAYASPEQIRGDAISIASDLYQLGVILYELLTGSRPYEVSGHSPAEIEKVICEEEPCRPANTLTETSGFLTQPEKNSPERVKHISKLRNATPIQLIKQLQGDLDTIILKALRKEPERRYESVGHLVDDIYRFKNHKPVTARRGTLQYRFGKWFARHKVAAIAGVIVFLSLALGAGIATWQAQEARQALTKTEEALERAEALHGFLTELFMPGALDRPADQLPGTEELLEAGARHALDEDMARAPERLGMLVTIGEIYIQQGRPEKAKPLLTEAIELGYEHKDEWPQDLSRALMLQARIVGWEGDRDESESMLLEAERLVQDLDQHKDLFAKIRSNRGYLEYYRGDHQRAIELAEPLYNELSEIEQPDPHLKNRIMNLLASSYGYLGKLEEANEHQDQVIENYKELDGDDSRTYAISLTNSVKLKYNLGRFDQAESNAQKALAIYEKLYDDPTSVLSVTYGALAISQLFEGRFDEALTTVETAGRNFAMVRDKDFDRWEVPQIYKGMMLAKMHRWDDAAPYLIENHEHFDEMHHSMRITYVEGLLAKALCRTDRISDGFAELANKSIDDDEISDNPVYRARLHEARARCHFEAGALEEAEREIKQSIEAMDFPGRAMERSERKLLLTEILLEQGAYDDARQQTQKAEQLFAEIGLTDHPTLDRIRHTDQIVLSYLD